MNSTVETAVAEIRTLFPGHRVEAAPLSDGGACVIVHDLPLSAAYEPETTWFGFVIPFNYPYADVYPHNIDGSVKRKDGKPLGEGFSQTNGWQGRGLTNQISRRSNRLDAEVDTAALKLAKVIEWVRSL